MSVIIMAFSIVLIVTGILRWIGPKEKRRIRLNILGWVSFAGITFFLLVKFYPTLVTNLANDNTDATKALIEVLKRTIKYIIIGSTIICMMVVAAAAFIVVAYGIWCLYCAITTLRTGEKQENELKTKIDHKCKILFASLKSPVFILLLTTVIIVSFFIVPLLAGDSESGSLLKCWISGISNIYSTLSADGSTAQDKISEALPYYTLIYILVVGIGYIAASILHNIVSKTFFTSQPHGFLDEYSTSIGLLGFGVALLLSISNTGNNQEWAENVSNFVKAMLTVVIATTLIILTLEIVRLLIDMRETLIRHQARYLFISVVGQGVVLIHQLFFFLYAVIGNILTDTSMNGDASEQKTHKIFQSIEQKVFDGIKTELDGSVDELARLSEGRQFKPFKKHRISKDGDLK